MFTEQETKIYRCPHTNRDYDPLRVRLTLTKVTQNAFGRLCDEARSDDPTKQANAQLLLIDAARKAFDLAPLKVLDATVWEALSAYTAWLRGKETRASNLPETSPCSDGPGSPATKTGCP